MLVEERIGHLILAFQKSKEEWSELFGLNFQLICFFKWSARQKMFIVFISIFISLLTSCLQHFDIFHFLKKLQLSLFISILEIYSTHKNIKEFVGAACLPWNPPKHGSLSTDHSGVVYYTGFRVVMSLCLSQHCLNCISLPILWWPSLKKKNKIRKNYGWEKFSQTLNLGSYSTFV